MLHRGGGEPENPGTLASPRGAEDAPGQPGTRDMHLPSPAPLRVLCAKVFIHPSTLLLEHPPSHSKAHRYSCHRVNAW